MKKNMLSIIAMGLSMVSMMSSCASEDVLFFQPTMVTTDQQNGTGDAGTDVTVYTTTADRQKQFAVSTTGFATEDNLSPSTIRIDAATKYQTMDGFGAAVTGSTCCNLLKMPEADRAKFLKQTFDKTEGMGYSYIRISIGCSDFSLSEYTCCDTKGIENFGLTDEETKYVIPVLKEILAINPDIKIMATPWTCPKWMKVNDINTKGAHDSWTGGHLNPDYYQDYATYFVKWIQAFKAEGINIYAVTPQNEPLNAGNSASLLMYWDEQLAFVRDALGPKFEAAGISTKIYAFDHNYNYDNMDSQQHYPLNIYADPAASKYFEGAAYHNYGGNVSEMGYIHEQAPQKSLIFTETSIGTWNDGQNFEKRLMEDMEEVGLKTIANYSSAVMVWNLMLDSERGPYRPGGCATCFGAVDIYSGDYVTITGNSHYYVVGQLSSVVKSGAVRVAAGGYTSGDVLYEAFVNPDGSHALVLLNKGAAKSVVVDDATHHFTAEIPAKSVVSYKW